MKKIFIIEYSYVDKNGVTIEDSISIEAHTKTLAFTLVYNYIPKNAIITNRF